MVSIPKGPGNYKKGQKAGSFYRLKNKEQEREKEEMNKEQGNACGTQRWFGLWRPADKRYCISGQLSIYGDMKIT